MRSKILVVEDEADAREAIVFLLQHEGFQTTSAGDGREALDSIAFDRPDLIITDLQMPEMDGLELIRTLRECSETRNLPIIVLTARRRRTQDSAVEAGADFIARKPVDIDNLIELVRGLLPSVLFSVAAFLR